MLFFLAGDAKIETSSNAILTYFMPKNYKEYR